MIVLTAANLALLMDCPQVRADRFVVPMQDALQRADLGADVRLAHFVAQVGHECGGLRHLEEIADGGAYEGRRDLGNTSPGDGKRYKGRGIIQLTGKRNYAAFDSWLGLAGLLVREPERVAQVLEYAVATAPFFWSTRGLNLLADADTGEMTTITLGDRRIDANRALVRITRAVNGGTNGLEDRQRRFIRALRILAKERADGRFAIASAGD